MRYPGPRGTEKEFGMDVVSPWEVVFSRRGVCRVLTHRTLGGGCTASTSSAPAGSSGPGTAP